MLLDVLFADLPADQQIYVAWKTADRSAPYTMDEWRALAWNTSLHGSLDDVNAFVDAHPYSDIYYGVVPRKNNDRNSLAPVLTLWVDIDAKEFGGDLDRARAAYEAFPARPSGVVKSGHGFHVYWLLLNAVSADTAQRVMKALVAFHGADDLHHPKSVLRVPGTYNWKVYDDPVSVSEVYVDDALRYEASDLEALCNVSAQTRVMITKGVLPRKTRRRPNPTRSERDWHVLRELLDVGVSEAGIRTIFDYQPVGDKYRAEGEHYLTHTLNNLRGQNTGGNKGLGIQDADDGYYVNTQAGRVRLSTFTFDPQRVVVNTDGAGEDALLGTIHTEDGSTPDILLPKSAFATSQAFMRYLPRIEWQWLGSDQHTKALLLHLTQQVRSEDTETVYGTSVIGRHGEYWVTREGTLGREKFYSPADAPIIYVDPAVTKMHETEIVPALRYGFPDEDRYRRLVCTIADLLPKINREEVILPALGWFAACPIKPLCEDLDIRFPHLNVFGMKGAGKTSMLYHVLMPLLGMYKPRAWTPNTTTFILRTLFSCTNAIPVHFGEFRSATLGNTRNDFMRVVLQAYEWGRDARGRADLTTEDFKLDAPVVIDGEDAVADPAFKERSIVVGMRMEDVMEHQPANEAYQALTLLPLHDFAGEYIRYTLSVDLDDLRERHQRALQKAREMWESPLPDRPRNNMAVVLLGLELFNEHLEAWGAKPIRIPRTIFDPMLENVLALRPDGTPRALVDRFVEDVINAVASQSLRSGRFIYAYEPRSKTLWVHLSSALNWWERERRSRGKVTLDAPAIRAQLSERSDYTVREQIKDTGNFGTVMCVGFRVDRCHEVGLEVPDDIPATGVLVGGGAVI